MPSFPPLHVAGESYPTFRGMKRLLKLVDESSGSPKAAEPFVYFDATSKGAVHYPLKNAIQALLGYYVTRTVAIPQREDQLYNQLQRIWKHEGRSALDRYASLAPLSPDPTQLRLVGLLELKSDKRYGDQLAIDLKAIPVEIPAFISLLNFLPADFASNPTSDKALEAEVKRIYIEHGFINADGQLRRPTARAVEFAMQRFPHLAPYLEDFSDFAPEVNAEHRVAGSAEESLKPPIAPPVTFTADGPPSTTTNGDSSEPPVEAEEMAEWREPSGAERRVEDAPESAHEDDGVQSSHLRQLEGRVVEQGYFTPASAEVELDRRMCEVVYRRGQPEFRAKLVAAYGSCCAISKCDAVQALEAAHILPYAESGSNHVTNGLLLRADIHTLFDLDLIRVDPVSFKVVLAEQLQGTRYEEMDGKVLSIPDDPALHPSRTYLLQRWDRSGTGANHWDSQPS